MNSSAVEATESKSPSHKRKGCHSAAGKYKHPPHPPKKSRTLEKVNPVCIGDDISTGDNSNGQTALHHVQAQEKAQAHSTVGSCGPVNNTFVHWHALRAIHDASGKHWSFKCGYCSKTCTVPWKVNSNCFDDEQHKPALRNLATHTNSFSAWNIDKDLPFKTSEVLGLKRLFEYLKVKFMLPMETTVRNVLVEMFANLHTTIIKDLANILNNLNEADDPNDNDHYLANKHLPFHYSPENDEAVQEMESQECADADVEACNAEEDEAVDLMS
ncbi:hypothetical protein WOLCODRAFT_19104 [Wolfiporia cocos MD-104 SS10]|uniref:Uncharacterized protein n=1 Tax=Wolfiporia cocos (strain MD-104) TaxID=742152 RepID=A0A2H3JXK6_WOLCO|nr:hypothetical protein WOLCODRAFT_19104 [Wolfiporia cocos MD-104 SS10]